MKILELSEYSAGACGVWMRARQEAELLSKRGHTAKVFSSNRVKGAKKIAPEKELLGKIEIRRFSAKKPGGEGFMFWNFRKEALDFRPDIIFAHSYRHPLTIKALKLKKKIGCRVFLITHAPFARSSSRSLPSKIAVGLYDKVIGRKTLKQFDKIIAITKWETAFLQKLGVTPDKIEYIPNGIKPDFFSIPRSSLGKKNQIIYTGRISPIKNLEVLIESFQKIKNKKVLLKIIGPAESDYLEKLKDLVSKTGLQKRIIIQDRSYTIKEQISELDKSKIFVLPSITEGMPQVLIEAMARGNVVISSNFKSAYELIEHGKNGYIFQQGDSAALAKQIDYVLSHNQESVEKEARLSVKQFSWDEIIKKIEKII